VDRARLVFLRITRPNIITDTLGVKDISQIGNNAWLVDFGKNFTGWMKMSIRNQNPGDTIDFLYSDFCDQKPVRISRYD